MDIEPIIRTELTTDRASIRLVHEMAFGGSSEADLVDRLREREVLSISLVAVLVNEVVGHIALSPMTFDDERGPAVLQALGPMAVLPDHQRKGIGSHLVVEGLEQCRRAGVRAVFVLGHPGFYPRFGFVPASRFGIRCEFPVPDEVFMGMELLPGALHECSGLIRYQREFRDV